MVYIYLFTTTTTTVLRRCCLGSRKGIRPVKTEWWGAGVVICLERGADLHTAQLMPLPLTVSCFSKIQIGFAFLVPAHLGSPGQRAVKRVCVLVGNRMQLTKASLITYVLRQCRYIAHCDVVTNLLTVTHLQHRIVRFRNIHTPAVRIYTVNGTLHNQTSCCN